MLKLIINVVAIFLGLGLFLVFANSNIGKKYERYQYFAAFVCIIIAVLVGGIVSKVLL